MFWSQISFSVFRVFKYPYQSTDSSSVADIVYCLKTYVSFSSSQLAECKSCSDSPRGKADSGQSHHATLLATNRNGTWAVLASHETLLWSLWWLRDEPLRQDGCLSLFRLGLPWWLSSKELTCNAGDLCSVPTLGQSPAEGNGNPVQYSWLGNFMGRGAWWGHKSKVQLSD